MEVQSLLFPNRFERSEAVELLERLETGFGLLESVGFDAKKVR